MKFQKIFDLCDSFLRTHRNGVVVVVGPTASGKTSLSIDLAKHIQNAEIINADSRQMYAGLPILTAVPTKEEQQSIVHHFFEIIDPQTTINVSHWKSMAEQKIIALHAQHKTPIICGGTGLFINSLTKNFSLGVEPNEALRKNLREKTTEELWELLHQKDPEACKTLHKNNKKYVIRALEICEARGSKTAYSNSDLPLFPFLILGVTHPREELYARIRKRNAIMFEQGVIDEAQQFLDTYTNIHSVDSAFIAHGLPEIQQYLSGHISLDTAKEIMILHTKRYAKRQLTWWRRDDRLHWFSGATGESIDIRNPEW